MKHRILLDADGVLADFTGWCTDLINDLRGTKFVPEDCTTWDFSNLLGPDPRTREAFWDIVSEEGVVSELKPFPYAKELVSDLWMYGDVWVVTSMMPSSPTWAHERVKWLEHHLQIDRHRVVFASDKSAVEGLVLIDDKVANLQEWQAGGKPLTRFPMLWERTYSGHGWYGPTVDMRTHESNLTRDCVDKAVEFVKVAAKVAR